MNRKKKEMENVEEVYLSILLRVHSLFAQYTVNLRLNTCIEFAQNTIDAQFLSALKDQEKKKKRKRKQKKKRWCKV